MIVQVRMRKPIRVEPKVYNLISGSSSFTPLGMYPKILAGAFSVVMMFFSGGYWSRSFE